MGNKCCENCGFVSSYGRPNYHSFDCSEDSTNTPTVDSSVDCDAKKGLLESLFAIHKTGDPDKIVKEAFEGCINAFSRYDRTALITRIKGEVEELGTTQIELFNGKLPFVIFDGKADESEKIAIYRQALTDLLNRIDKIV